MQGLEDVGGLHELKVNGVLYNLKGDPTYQPGGRKHTPILAMVKPMATRSRMFLQRFPERLPTCLLSISWNFRK